MAEISVGIIGVGELGSEGNVKSGDDVEWLGIIGVGELGSEGNVKIGDDVERLSLYN